MKPQPKREVAISCIHKIVNVIIFDASADAAEDLSEFGEVAPVRGNRYRLIVDARYDFDEVVAYIENYGDA